MKTLPPPLIALFVAVMMVAGVGARADEAMYGRFEVPAPTRKEVNQGYRDFPPNVAAWNTREFWQQQKTAVEARDGDGRDLIDRANACENVEEQIDVYATNAMQRLIERHMTFSGGYIPHNAVEYEQRNIQTIAMVAYRDIRYIKYHGADARGCDAVADRAAHQIDTLMSKYP